MRMRSRAQWEGVVLSLVMDDGERTFQSPAVCLYVWGKMCTMMERTLHPLEEAVCALVPLEMRMTAGLCATQPL